MKCKAKNRAGKPCGNWALPGTTVCRMHGGKSPQVQQAADRRLALKRAERLVQAAGLDMDPVAHLLDSLYRQAALVAAYAILVADLDDNALTESNNLGDRKMHTFVVAYERANSERARIAKLCGDLKVGERQIQLAERMGEQLSMLFERTVSAIKGLSEAQRLQAATAYAREIARLERPAIDGTARDAA